MSSKQNSTVKLQNIKIAACEIQDCFFLKQTFKTKLQKRYLLKLVYDSTPEIKDFFREVLVFIISHD